MLLTQRHCAHQLYSPQLMHPAQQKAKLQLLQRNQLLPTKRPHLHLLLQLR